MTISPEVHCATEVTNPPSTQREAETRAAIYDPATIQGIAAARQVFDAIERLKDDLTAYGDGARILFATLLSHRCPDRLAGLGAATWASWTASSTQSCARELAQRMTSPDELADAAKGEEKRGLARWRQVPARC